MLISRAGHRGRPNFGRDLKAIDISSAAARAQHSLSPVTARIRSDEQTLSELRSKIHQFRQTK
jgi:hypothetical protein